MYSTRPPIYVLQELPDITGSINYPIKNVQRIKYTCFDVSKTLIAFGATSGGIYVFNRTPCEFVQLIPNKDGTITRLAISDDESHIAFANGRGIVTVTECSQSLNGGHSSVISKEHQGNEVTTIAWSGNNVFTGDDVGKISVLQLQRFITKAMFTSSSQTIMNLDSRICQLDVKGTMLLISTLTRCYICDTAQEQYRQIGQKLRDGEFGACFLTLENKLENGSIDTVKDFAEAKKYNIVNEEEKFAVGPGLENVMIYCARPSSRLWEANIDGTVKRTHQFKHVLGRKPIEVVTVEDYNNQHITINDLTSEGDGQSVNFNRLSNVNEVIFAYKKDALYFLDVKNETNTVWLDKYKDIVDIKIYHDNLYVWLTNASIVSLKLMKIDKFLIKCYIDEKYDLCSELCALYSDYLLHNSLSSKLHILVGLRHKIKKQEILNKIEDVLIKLDNLKTQTTHKTGIFVVDNTFRAQSSFDENIDNAKTNNDATALQTLKDLSVSVTDKLSSSKKILKEKWEDFEGKIKHLNNEKSNAQDYNLPKRISLNESVEANVPLHIDNSDIIYKETSQKTIDVNIDDKDDRKSNEVCKLLYQYYRLNLVDRETENSNLITTIESYSCDINEIYNLMLLLELYCVSVEALGESKFVPNYIFLNYVSLSSQKDALLESIIENEVLYKYFVDSCISVNLKTQKLGNISCECGFPLPFSMNCQTPAFSKLIDEFIEKQWKAQTRDQCYEMCKKMPFLWRKILCLRRNEDLLSILRIILQMLDENLLHSFLPQFTVETWDRTVQLYATLHANMCLNCNRKFENISVKETLSWDDLGALIIKSVGGKNAIKIMEKHASLIDAGELSMRFYHCCILVSLYEKYDKGITNQLTDAIYSSYQFEDSRSQICGLLRTTLNGQIKNTALPILVAAKTHHWGLIPVTENTLESDSDSNNTKKVSKIKDATVSDVIDNISAICSSVDCTLCGLPLDNEVLIKDGGLWVFKCGHTFHGECLDLHKLMLCPECCLEKT